MSDAKRQRRLNQMTPGRQRFAAGAAVFAVVLIVVLIVVLLRNAGQRTTTQTTAPQAPQQAGLPAWLHVYFTTPTLSPDGKATDKAVDRYVVPVLNGAKKTIDVTSFDLNLPSVVNALTAAEKRGVHVRVVVDETNGTQMLKASDAPDGKDFDALKAFKAAGVPVVDGGRSNGLMHNKIIVVDNATLFMGSWNMSFNDAFRNNNNLLEITDPGLIANYEAKFTELFVNQRFGTKARVGAQTPQLTPDGVQVENYFSPVDHVMDKLVADVKGAKTSIKFLAFTYTDGGLRDAMIARAKAGVKVEGVIENRGASQGALPGLFCSKAVQVKVDGNKYTMHHKVIIVDDQYVITGSFNFTQTANQANDDNVLIIHSRAVAALYDQEFDRVYGAGQSPATAC